MLPALQKLGRHGRGAVKFPDDGRLVAPPRLQHPGSPGRPRGRGERGGVGATETGAGQPAEGVGAGVAGGITLLIFDVF